MKYPTWEVKSSPTPAERLLICETCQEGSWHMHGFPVVAYCSRCNRRLRKATNTEIAEAKKSLDYIIHRGEEWKKSTGVN